MKNKIFKIIAVILCSLLFIPFFRPVGRADFGDFAGDYDYDFGDYDYDYDYDDYDYDYDDDYGGYDWDDDDDDDYDYSPGYYGGSSSGSGHSGKSGGGGIAAVLIIIILAIVFSILPKKHRRCGRRGNVISRNLTRGANNLGTAIGTAAVSTIINQVMNAETQNGQNPVRANGSEMSKATDSSLRPMSELKEIDKNFNEAEMKEKISNLYVRFQQAWCNKNIEELRPYLTDSYYAQIDRQLNDYRINNKTPHVERIAVLDVVLKGWKKEENNIVLVAGLRTRITEYTTSDATGSIIRGSKSAEKFMEYEWNLVRSADKQTAEKQALTDHHCPNCGAPIDINKTAVCEYCGSVITVDEYDWCVSGIKGISQRTA